MGRFWSDQRTTSEELKTQNMWLTNRGAIQRAATTAAAQLLPSETLNASRLVATVNSLATDAGIANFSSNDPSDVSNGQFAVHTISFTVNKVTWDSLRVFYPSLTHKAPYLTIEGMTIVRERGNPLLLDISLKISSVEVVQAGS